MLAKTSVGIWSSDETSIHEIKCITNVTYTKQTKQTKTEPATSTCTRATGCLFLGEVIYAEGHEAGVRLPLHVGRKGRDGGDARVKRSKSRVGLHKESTHALASWGRSPSKIHVHFSVGLSIHAYHH